MTFLEVQEVSEKAMTGSEAATSNCARKQSYGEELVAQGTITGQATPDVTGLSEFAVELMERRYRELIDHSPHATVIHEAGRLVYVNPAAVRWIAATSADQLVGHSIAEFVQLASVPAFLVRLSALQHLGDASEPSEAVLTKFDGTTLVVEVISVLTRWEGRPAYQVIFRDISADRAVEAHVRLQAALIDAVSDPVIGTTRDGIVTSWNPAAELVYRRSASEALNQPIRAMVGARLDPAAILAAGGIAHLDHRTIGGSVRTKVSVSATDSGFLVVITDQSVLRRAELAESVLDSLQQAVVVADRQGDVRYFNAAAERVLGIELADEAIPATVTALVARLLDGQLGAGAAVAVDESMPAGGQFDESVVEFSRRDGGRIALTVNRRLLDPENPDQSDIVLSLSDVAAGPQAR